MKTQWLTEWQILAIIESVRANPSLNAASAADLLSLLEKATHIRVTLKGETA